MRTESDTEPARRRDLLRVAFGLVAMGLAGCCQREDVVIPDRIERELVVSAFRASPGNLILPVGVPVELKLRSADYIYAFQSPDLGVNAVTVPGVECSTEVVARECGEFVLAGNQMCGAIHPGLVVTVKVIPAEEFFAAGKSGR